MSFLVYFAVLLVAAASALFGLDLLTSPLPPDKPRTQAASTTVPADKQAKREAAREAADKQANATLSPVYPRPSGENKDVRMVYPPTNETLARATTETTGSGKTETEANSAPSPQQQPAQQAAQQTEQPKQEQPAQPQQAPQQAPQEATPTPSVTPVSTQSGPQCNVQACVAAYRSFRAEDCTYQPFDGPRRFCERSGSTTQARAEEPARSRSARNERASRSGDATLDAIARRVKQLTERDLDDDFDAPVGRRVIVIERGGGLWR